MGIYYVASTRKNLESEVFCAKDVMCYSPVELHHDQDLPISHPGILLSQLDLDKLKSVKEIAIEAASFNFSNPRVLIITHGYRVSEANAMEAYCDLLKGLATAGFTYDVIIFLLWPGSWAVAGFELAAARSETCAKMLGPLVDEFSTRGFLVDVEAHSLGCHLWLAAMESIKTQGNHLILTSPASDNDGLTLAEGRFVKNAEKFKRISVCYSADDSVLSKAYFYGSAFWRVLTFGWVKRGIHRALGFTGPLKEHPANVVAYNFSGIIKAHGDWKKCQEFLNKSTIWRPELETKP